MYVNEGLCSIPGLGRSLREGKGYPLQYSGLENSMDCIVHGVAKSWIQLSDFHTHTYFILKNGRYLYKSRIFPVVILHVKVEFTCRNCTVLRSTRPSRTNTQKRCPFHHRGLERKSRTSRDTQNNRQVLPWNAT